MQSEKEYPYRRRRVQRRCLLSRQNLAVKSVNLYTNFKSAALFKYQSISCSRCGCGCVSLWHQSVFVAGEHRFHPRADPSQPGKEPALREFQCHSRWCDSSRAGRGRNLEHGLMLQASRQKRLDTCRGTFSTNRPLKGSTCCGVWTPTSPV